MERPGWADGHAVHLRKTIALEVGSPALEIHYVLDGLPPDVTLHFAVEINLAGMAGHAHDRYYSDPAGARLGMLDARLDLPAADGVSLTDEWLDLSVGLRWSQPSGLWCFPIETVSQSEAGYEGVYQSSAVIPHWRVRADAAQIRKRIPGRYAEVEPEGEHNCVVTTRGAWSRYVAGTRSRHHFESISR